MSRSRKPPDTLADALKDAAMRGDLARTQELIAQGADPNVKLDRSPVFAVGATVDSACG